MLQHYTTAGSLYLLPVFGLSQSSKCKPPVPQALSLCNSCSPRAKFKSVQFMTER